MRFAEPYLNGRKSTIRTLYRPANRQLTEIKSVLGIRICDTILSSLLYCWFQQKISTGIEYFRPWHLIRNTQF